MSHEKQQLDQQVPLLPCVHPSLLRVSLTRHNNPQLTAFLLDPYLSQLQ